MFDYKCSVCSEEKGMKTHGEDEIFEYCNACAMETYFKKQLSAPIGFILKGQGFYRNSSTHGREG